MWKALELATQAAWLPVRAVNQSLGLWLFPLRSLQQNFKIFRFYHSVFLVVFTVPPGSGSGA